MSDETIGSKLLRLKDRSGLTLNNIARAARYSSASSLQRYFSADYSPAHLPRAVADRLNEALVGFGDPPITRTDVEELTETGFYLKRQTRTHVSLRRTELSYISCHPSYALGANAYEIETEVMAISEEEEVRRFNKPPGYGYRHIHATYVSTSSMMPRFQPGEIIFYETDRPPIIGADVIVCLQVEDLDAAYALGRLVSQTASHIGIQTLSPETRGIVIHRDNVQMMHPILSTADVLGEYASLG